MTALAGMAVRDRRQDLPGRLPGSAHAQKRDLRHVKDRWMSKIGGH
jgi:hypothetical protein